jgi:opacity protein-like surface antigen
MRTCRLLILWSMAIFTTVGVLSSMASAQDWQGGLNFQLGFPTGEYRDQINTTAAGIAGDFLYSPYNSPFGIGVSLGWFQVGREEREEPFSTAIPDVTVDVKTEHGLAQFMILARVQPKRGPILPYADALIGLNYLYTKTTIENASNGEEVASTTNSDDNTFAYGFGGGSLIRVYDGTNKAGGKPVKVYVDLNFRYTLGGEADYLKEGSIRRDSGVVTYDFTRSRTDISTAHLGVAVIF